MAPKNKARPYQSTVEGRGALPAIAANGAWAIAVPLQHTAINNLTSLI